MINPLAKELNDTLKGSVVDGLLSDIFQMELSHKAEKLQKMQN